MKRIALLFVLVLALPGWAKADVIVVDQAPYLVAAGLGLQRSLTNGYQNAPTDLLAYRSDSGVVHVKLNVCPGHDFAPPSPGVAGCHLYEAESSSFQLVEEDTTAGNLPAQRAHIVATLEGFGDLDLYLYYRTTAEDRPYQLCNSSNLGSYWLVASSEFYWSPAPWATGVAGDWSVGHANCLVAANNATFSWQVLP